MPWKKKGRLFVPDTTLDWMQSHAAVPVPLRMEDRIRILFSSRDSANRSRLGWVDVDSHDPNLILGVSKQPILELGDLGTFDDNGMMPASVVPYEDQIRLYYIGWNTSSHVPYRLAIGLAISQDQGQTFTRYSQGPLLDRSPIDPYFCTTPMVLREADRWRMWYASCSGWELVDEKPEARYRILYAESHDGIIWNRTGQVCIDYDEFTQAIASPFVIKHGSRYRMWFSYRGLAGFRTDREFSYRLGYAESEDGLHWDRQDFKVGIERSETGWDSEMIEYASVLAHPTGMWMFYNGNGFGRSGFGYAEWLP